MAITNTLRSMFGRIGYFPARTGRRNYTYRGADFPPAPSLWGGTEPEWKLWMAHGMLGIPEGSFGFKVNLENPYTISGRTEVDFMEWDVGIAIRVQGTFYHYVGFDGFQPANDLRQRTDIESLGYPVVDIDEDDANRDPVYYLRAAREGRDYSRLGRGVI